MVFEWCTIGLNWVGCWHRMAVSLVYCVWRWVGFWVFEDIGWSSWWAWRIGLVFFFIFQVCVLVFYSSICIIASSSPFLLFLPSLHTHTNTPTHPRNPKPPQAQTSKRVTSTTSSPSSHRLCASTLSAAHGSGVSVWILRASWNSVEWGGDILLLGVLGVVWSWVKRSWNWGICWGFFFAASLVADYCFFVVVLWSKVEFQAKSWWVSFNLIFCSFLARGGGDYFERLLFSPWKLLRQLRIPFVSGS